LSTFNGKKVLVTGGSSGIGLATATKLAADNAEIWLLARREEQLNLASKICCPEEQVHILTADVANANQVLEAVDSMLRQAGAPDILINSAGITYPGDFADIDLGIFRQLIEINYLGMVAVTKAVLPGMLARGSGTIVNIASMGGIISIPGYSAYGASKAAVRGFTDALRAEVKPKGLHVVIVFPPDTDTPQLREELPLRGEIANALASLDAVMQPEEVAEAIIRGIVRKQYMVIPGAGNKFFYWFFSLAGTAAYPILDLFIAWAVRKIGKSKNGSEPK
jgi:3-dehydrosphinganine reductase